MENSELRNAESLDFSRLMAYNDLKIGEVYLPADRTLEGGSCYGVFNEIWKACYDEFAV